MRAHGRDPLIKLKNKKKRKEKRREEKRGKEKKPAVSLIYLVSHSYSMFGFLLANVSPICSKFHLAVSMSIIVHSMITAPPVLQETSHSFANQGRWNAQMTSILYKTSNTGDFSWASVNTSWTSTVDGIPTFSPEATHQSHSHITSPHPSLVIFICVCLLFVHSV